eukprot:CAMPEP_0115862338 /NCGR_PEP_ID=MMETSP0287-20121206/18122_1 /TAXON_ID=412157 /ORGANISM="Chrysochromulina rotalis, Strain UIO044" /LENGTH=229 /DNA_ID=CAMNT_0003316751 /DNA_START=30 /DNA_END=720 /DNA_ORIENTATION=+
MRKLPTEQDHSSRAKPVDGSSSDPPHLKAIEDGECAFDKDVTVLLPRAPLAAHRLMRALPLARTAPAHPVGARAPMLDGRDVEDCLLRHTALCRPMNTATDREGAAGTRICLPLARRVGKPREIYHHVNHAIACHVDPEFVDFAIARGVDELRAARSVDGRELYGVLDEGARERGEVGERRLESCLLEGVARVVGPPDEAHASALLPEITDDDAVEADDRPRLGVRAQC